MLFRSNGLPQAVLKALHRIPGQPGNEVHVDVLVPGAAGIGVAIQNILCRVLTADVCQHRVREGLGVDGDAGSAVYDRMEKMKKDLPEDVHYNYGFDNTKFIRASIDEVKQTVYEAFVLVIIIIFLFLRDWRVTLVPCIVIPVSLIGAFFVMYLAGFSINVLSMLAVVLAVGLVVDDAIVMTENIYVRIEKGMPPKEAGIEGAKEIFFAVISTTITLVAVFFPIVFMDGTTGDRKSVV